MKKLHHIVITSHSEVMFRTEEDYLRGINCLALSCIATNSKVGTFSFQSDHTHYDAFTDSPGLLVCSFKDSYFKYFNHKYHREGSLGETGYYDQVVDGPRHIEAAESYILRNAVHHGIASTPFGYPFNSTACYFPQEFGRVYLGTIDFSKYRRGQFLPANRRPPLDALMNPQGMIKPELFVEARLVEKYYGSARGFNYCLTRLSSEEWKEGQRKDGIEEPITLEGIEQWALSGGDKAATRADIAQASIDRKATAGADNVSDAIARMLENERGRTRDNMLNDIELCELIDYDLLRRFGVESYTQLSAVQREKLFQMLLSRRDCTPMQVARCLANPWK